MAEERPGPPLTQNIPVDQRVSVGTVRKPDGTYANICSACGDIGDDGVVQHMLKSHAGAL